MNLHSTTVHRHMMAASHVCLSQAYMLHFDKVYCAHECQLCDSANNLASSILHAFAGRGIMSSKLLDKAQLEQVASRSKQRKIIM